jgi:hypothetical protein
MRGRAFEWSVARCARGVELSAGARESGEVKGRVEVSARAVAEF